MSPTLPDPTLPVHPDVIVESAERVWRGRFPVDLVRFRQRRFDGALSGTRTWELWRRGPAAALIPYDPRQDRLVLIEQFRLPALAAGIDPVMVELPAGLCDQGESPEATVRREAHEEMGIDVGRLVRVGAFLLTSGGSDELCTIFAGEINAPQAGPDGLVGHAGEAAEHEDIRVRVWAADTMIEAAIAGHFANSVTTIGLLWLAARRDWLRAQWSAP